MFDIGAISVYNITLDNRGHLSQVDPNTPVGSGLGFGGDKAVFHDCRHNGPAHRDIGALGNDTGTDIVDHITQDRSGKENKKTYSQ